MAEACLLSANHEAELGLVRLGTRLVGLVDYWIVEREKG